MIREREIELTPTEFEVLKLLIRHAGTILTPEAIVSRVWGTERTGDTALVKHYVYRLRQKIEPDPASPQYLHTVRGRGYSFNA